MEKEELEPTEEQLAALELGVEGAPDDFNPDEMEGE